MTFKGECLPKSADGAITKIKDIVCYERANSHFLYASFQGVWADGKVGAANLHDVNEAMDKTFAWQAADAT